MRSDERRSYTTSPGCRPGALVLHTRRDRCLRDRGPRVLWGRWGACTGRREHRRRDERRPRGANALVQPAIASAFRGFLDLYVLGVHGRRQVQVQNVYDRGFAGTAAKSYEGLVNEALARAGGGGFEVVLDRSIRGQHITSPHALEWIASDLRDRGRRGAAASIGE
jgi:hypothetical protein